MTSYSKILVVYYSRSGNTRTVAESIAKKLKCETVFLAGRPYTGWQGYGRALMDTLLRRRIQIEPVLKNLGNYDLILVGGPVWASAIAAPVREFLTEYQPKLGAVGFFVTQGGARGSTQVLEEMSRLAKKPPVRTLVLSARDLKQSSLDRKIEGFVAPFRGPPKQFISETRA